MKKALTILFMVSWSISIYSQETLNVVFYNLLNFPEAPPSNRDEILNSIIDEIQPDILTVSELQSEIGAELILNNSLRTIDDRYSRADFVYNQSTSDISLQQMVFYNNKKLNLEDQNEIITDIRDINHYTFTLKTANNSTNPIYLEVFAAHLKASQGFENEELRLEMVLDFTNYLATIPSDHFVLFTGDLNFYTSNENGYQELLDPTNAIVLKDPIESPGNWHTNMAFQDIHTQSTRISNTNFDGFGAGGGLDDRFDFILISQNLIDHPTLHYVSDSYQAIGNNGNCFNENINDISCSGIDYTQDLRDNLYNMSDHLPVMLRLETDQVLTVVENNENKNLYKFKNRNVIVDMLELDVDIALLGRELEIYNTLGQKIHSKTINAQIVKIDASHLKNGIYYISLANTTQAVPLKFVKL